jgi:hypothetical protein
MDLAYKMKTSEIMLSIITIGLKIVKLYYNETAYVFY